MKREGDVIMASIYEEGLQLIDEKFGTEKIILFPLRPYRESSADGNCPVVRQCNGYYEDCTLCCYIWKIKQNVASQSVKCGGFSCSPRRCLLLSE